MMTKKVFEYGFRAASFHLRGGMFLKYPRTNIRLRCGPGPNTIARNNLGGETPRVH